MGSPPNPSPPNPPSPCVWAELPCNSPDLCFICLKDVRIRFCCFLPVFFSGNHVKFFARDVELVPLHPWADTLPRWQLRKMTCLLSLHPACGVLYRGGSQCCWSLSSYVVIKYFFMPRMK